MSSLINVFHQINVNGVFIVLHCETLKIFLSKIYRPYEQSDMQTGTEWPIVTVYV